MLRIHSIAWQHTCELSGTGEVRACIRSAPSHGTLCIYTVSLFEQQVTHYVYKILNIGLQYHSISCLLLPNPELIHDNAAHDSGAKLCILIKICIYFLTTLGLQMGHG